MGHVISVFVRELPIIYIYGGIFLPVALLLLSLISYLRLKLEEGTLNTDEYLNLLQTMMEDSLDDLPLSQQKEATLIMLFELRLQQRSQRT